MEDHMENAAMPKEGSDGKRETETAENAAGANAAGTETESETGQEERKEEAAAEERCEQDPGTDTVADAADAENAGNEAAADAENAGKEAEEADEKAAESAENDPEEKAPEKEKTSRGGIFRNKKELQKKDQEIAELKDQLLRARAEFDNYRKRTDKEKAVRFDDGAMFILQKLLPVVDNFERGLAQVPEEAKNDPYVEGLAKIYKQLSSVLEESGVTPIEAVGKEFNPELHNAVMHVDDEELDENVVAEEFQKGYSYKEHVLRHSMVKVAN